MKQHQHKVRGLPDAKLAEILNNHRAAIIQLAKEVKQGKREQVMALRAGGAGAAILWAGLVWQWVS